MTGPAVSGISQQNICEGAIIIERKAALVLISLILISRPPQPHIAETLHGEPPARQKVLRVGGR